MWVVVLALWSVFLGTKADEIFEFYGDSHYEFGLQMGQRFQDKIQQRMQLNTKLQTLLVPFSKTPMGEELLSRYITAHREVFPLYVEELEGIADGNDPKFVAYTYLGDLPSGAFGFNEHGVAFTLNFVQPSEIFVEMRTMR
eukprot:jgi/Phyca11/20989/fgenesh1_pg.PHYCAscaffold_78_\